MKKLLFCLAIVALATLTSCTKETTYTFTNNMDYSSYSNIRERYTFLREYDINGHCVANNSIESSICGKSYAFTANDRTELVKVYLKVKTTSSEISRWVQQVYYLEKGKNTDITIDGETIVGPSEP